MQRPRGLARAFSIGLVAVLLAVSCGGQGTVSPGVAAPTATAAQMSPAAGARIPITIGVLQTMTGGAAYYGLRLSQGIQLAVDSINASGGILGRPVEYTLQDTATDNAQAVALFRKVASDEKIPVVIGPSHSANYLAAAPVAEQLRVLWVSAASGANWPAGLPNDWNFRNTVPFREMTPQLIKAVIPKLAPKKVASIFSPDNVGVSDPQKLTVEAIASLGGNIDQSLKLEAPTGTKEFGSYITKILEFNPEVVIVNLVTADASAFMKQARDRGVKAQFVAGHNGLLDLNVLKLSANAADGLIVPSHFDPNDTSNAETKRFVDAWVKKYGPIEDLISSYSWDMVYTIKHVMEKAGTVSDRKKLRDTWATVSNLCLAGGCYTWEGKGDRLKATVFPVVLGSGGFQKFNK